MHIAIGHHVKGRLRNVHLDKATEDVVEETKDQTLPSPMASVRSSSVYSNKENTNAQPPYRSMLDVEVPPTLGPLKAVSLDKLFDDNVPLSSCQASPQFLSCSGSVLQLAQNMH